MTNPYELKIDLHVADSDELELDTATSNMRSALLDLSLDNVTLSRGPAPEGAKGDAINAGTLVVTLANSAVLVAVVQVVRAWIVRAAGRSAKISDGEKTYELTGITAAQQQQIIDSLLAKADISEDPNLGQVAADRDLKHIAADRKLEQVSADRDLER